MDKQFVEKTTKNDKIEKIIIRCKICGEESGGRGTSLWGMVHKYGPMTHHFQME